MMSHNTKKTHTISKLMLFLTLLLSSPYSMAFEQIFNSVPISTYYEELDNGGKKLNRVYQNWDTSFRLRVTGGGNYEVGSDELKGYNGVYYWNLYDDDTYLSKLFQARIKPDDVIEVTIDNIVENKDTPLGYIMKVRYDVMGDEPYEDPENKYYLQGDTISLPDASQPMKSTFKLKRINWPKDERVSFWVVVELYRLVKEDTPHSKDTEEYGVGRITFHFVLDNGVEKDPVVIVDDTKASANPGETGSPIPLGAILAITGAVVLGAGAYFYKKKKNKDSEESEDGEEPDRAELRTYKAFGDTLIVGEQPRQVFARVVRIREDGSEYTDPLFTDMMRISSADNYLQVEPGEMYGEWKTVWISAPSSDAAPPPKEGVVSFSFGNEGGSYTNRMHFDIKEGQMHFAQENLTLPARYKKEVRLPFVIDGMDADAKVEVTLTDKSGQPTDMYEVHVEWNKEKEVQEAVIRDKVLDEEKDSHDPGHFIEFNMHLEAHNGKGLKVRGDYLLVRFYMGIVYDIGAGYDGYEVGCYIEEYNAYKHAAKVIWAPSGKKTFVPAETKSYLRIYDYDEEEHSIIIVSPKPEPKLFSVRALDETEQERVEKLGLNYQAQNTGHPRGTECILRCTRAVLDSPSRIDAVVQFGAMYKNREYKCEKQVLLCSQPRRDLHDTAVRDALVRQDRHLLDNMHKIEETIERLGLMDRLLPLVNYMHIMEDAYTEDYGIDREQARLVSRVYAYMLGTVNDYESVENTKPLSVAGEVLKFFEDMGVAIHKTYMELSSDPSLQVTFILARLAIGVFTLGKSEGFFRLLDAFSIGMLEISVAEMYVDHGGDHVTEQMKVMVKEAAKWQIFSMGMQLCLHIALTPVGGSAPLATRASTSKPKAKSLPKGSGKQYSSGKKSAAVKRAVAECDSQARRVRKEVRSPGARAKSKGRIPKKSLRKGIEYGKAKAIEDIDNLRSIIDVCKAESTPENQEMLRKLVFDVQRNKQAMNRLKALGPEYDYVRKVFNREMLKIYNETDLEVMYELARRHNISLDRIKRGIVSGNKMDDLISGKTITYDRDTHFYYLNDKGEKIYFGQKYTEQLYNRCFYERALGFEAKDQAYANRFAVAMDQVVIEDAINHPESLGPVDINILSDKNQHYKPLDNAKKVRDTIIYKTEERLAEGDRLYELAQTIDDPQLRESVEAEAVYAYIEGNRQTIKDFKKFVRPYDKARKAINGKSYVTDRMIGACEEIELMFESSNPIDLDELNVKLSDRGYTARSLVHDVAEAIYKAGGGQ